MDTARAGGSLEITRRSWLLATAAAVTRTDQRAYVPFYCTLFKRKAAIAGSAFASYGKFLNKSFLKESGLLEKIRTYFEHPDNTDSSYPLLAMYQGNKFVLCI